MSYRLSVFAGMHVVPQKEVAVGPATDSLEYYSNFYCGAFCSDRRRKQSSETSLILRHRLQEPPFTKISVLQLHLLSPQPSYDVPMQCDSFNCSDEDTKKDD